MSCFVLVVMSRPRFFLTFSLLFAFFFTSSCFCTSILSFELIITCVVFLDSFIGVHLVEVRSLRSFIPSDVFFFYIGKEDEFKTLFGERNFTILRKTTTPRKLVITSFLLRSSVTTGREHVLCTKLWQIYIDNCVTWSEVSECWWAQRMCELWMPLRVVSVSVSVNVSVK